MLKIGDKVAKRLEDVFHVAHGYLDRNLPTEQMVSVPIILTVLNDGQDIDGLVQSAKERCVLNRMTLAAFGWNIKTLAVILVKDDSMEPSIPEGTKVLIYYSQKDIQLNRVYAIRIFNDIYLRRVSKSPTTGNLILNPDSLTLKNNTTYEKIELEHNNFEIVGRAILVLEGLIK